MGDKRWKKERTRHMKKLHGLMLAGEEVIHPRDLTEAIMWFVPEEFVNIQDTKRFTLLGRECYLVAGNVYRHEGDRMTKLSPNEKEMEFIQSLTGVGIDETKHFGLGPPDKSHPFSL